MSTLENRRCDTCLKRFPGRKKECMVLIEQITKNCSAWTDDPDWFGQTAEEKFLVQIRVRQIKDAAKRRGKYEGQCQDPRD